jgi:transposase-like protein
MADSTDWELIGREYRAGQLSIREIARQHELSETAIRKRARKEGWARDLTAQVRERVRTELVRNEVRTPNAREPEREIIDAAARRGVEVVQGHRRDIAALRVLAERLASKATLLIEEVADLKDLDAATGCIESLARTEARLIPLERQAFNLDAEGDKPPETTDTIRADIDAIRRKYARDPGA